MQWLRLRPETPEELEAVDWRGRWINEDDEYDDSEEEEEEDRQMEDFDPEHAEDDDDDDDEEEEEETRVSAGAKVPRNLQAPTLLAGEKALLELELPIYTHTRYAPNWVEV